MRIVIFYLALTAAVGLVMASPGWAYDRTEANGCADCHSGAGAIVMPFVVGKWLESNHADSYHGSNGNTYCAKCHSPFQANPLATHDDNMPVPLEEWEAVTCSACHPPHDLRVEWGTPIGIYDVATGEHSPVYLDDANMLCEYCHTDRHEKDFQGYGQEMFEHKDVRCIDCHMAEIPVDDEGVSYRAAHNFEVAANLPWSCGTYAGGCHESHTEEWAAKQIAKEKIHGKIKTH